MPLLQVSINTSYLQFVECADIVGEYTLADLGSIPMDQLQEIASTAIDILQQIHKQGIVHRDIKPVHLVVCRHSLYLIDYGNAGPIGTNATFYTEKFASPRSLIGVSDERSDFETLWFTLLSCCQKLPWDKENISEKELFVLKMKSLPQYLAPTLPQLANCFSNVLEDI